MWDLVKQYPHNNFHSRVLYIQKFKLMMVHKKEPYSQFRRSIQECRWFGQNGFFTTFHSLVNEGGRSTSCNRWFNHWHFHTMKPNWYLGTIYFCFQFHFPSSLNTKSFLSPMAMVRDGPPDNLYFTTMATSRCVKFVLWTFVYDFVMIQSITQFCCELGFVKKYAVFLSKLKSLKSWLCQNNGL